MSQQSTPWKHTSAVAFAFVQSLFSFSPSGQSGGVGVCFAKGMTARNKVAGRIVFPGVVFGAIGIVWLAHWAVYAVAEYLVHMTRRHGNSDGRRGIRDSSETATVPAQPRTEQPERMPWYRRVHDAGPPSVGRYASAVACFLSIAFITLSLAAVEMIQCFTMNERLVWLWDAEVECYGLCVYFVYLCIVCVCFPVCGTHTILRNCSLAVCVERSSLAGRGVRDACGAGAAAVRADVRDPA